jgi:hypothetical protein
MEPDIGDLLREIQALERRVRKLEQRLSESPELAAPPETPEVEPGALLPPNLLPMLGGALLAIAGAYVLRALTEARILSPAAGVTLGLAYGVSWLFVAALRPRAAKFPVGLFAVTSVVIVAPLVWEALTRLKVISAWTSAAVLCAYTFVGLALAWRSGRRLIAAIVSTAATLIAVVLLFGTYNLWPFTLVLLAVGAALEFEACCGRPGGSRWLTAACADLAVILLTWMVSRKEGMPEGYVATSTQAAFSAQVLLLGIYVGSAAIRTLIQRHSFTLLETMQTTAALGIGIQGAAALVAGNAAGTLRLGLFALGGGMASYVVSFAVVGPQMKWNFRIWASLGMLLVLAGTFLLLPASGYWVLWCGCAVVCCWTAMVTRLPTLGLHGAAYLLLGALASGAAAQPLSQWFGMTGDSAWRPAALVVTCALLAWVAVIRSPAGEGAPWRKQASSFILAAVLTWMLAGAATRVLVRAWPGNTVPAATLGTVVLTLLSAALAWSGKRWEKRELIWLVYGFMSLAAWKLAVRDFEREHSLTLVVSLLFYGGTLILLPRVLSRKASG